MTPEDREFLTRFHDGSLDSFHHLDHLRLAWLVIKQHGMMKARPLIPGGIRNFAALRGSIGLYHETFTMFWIGIVNHAIEGSTNTLTFESFLARNPILLNKNLPYRHWTTSILQSSEAKTKWIAPDLMSLPWVN